MRTRALSASLVLLAPLAWAEPPTGFLTPSRNIGCQSLAHGAEPAQLRCDLRTIEAKPPGRPKDCELDWGDSVAMSARGRASWVCHGDTVFDELVVLEYGQTWEANGFRCTSEKTGLSCTNLDGHGWTLSRKKQTLR